MRNTLIFFLISLLIIGCKDETTTTSTIHDPSKPVQITGFVFRISKQPKITRNIQA